MTTCKKPFNIHIEPKTPKASIYICPQITIAKKRSRKKKSGIKADLDMRRKNYYGIDFTNYVKLKPEDFAKK